MELNRTVAVAVLLRRPAGGGGARVRLHGAFGRTRERQLLFRPLGCSTSCGRPRPEWPRAAERGRPTPRSLRLSASVEDQVGERRRRAVGFIIASSAPSLQPAFNIFLPWPGFTRSREGLCSWIGQGQGRRAARFAVRGSRQTEFCKVPSARSASANADGIDNTCVAFCQVVKYISTYVWWKARARVPSSRRHCSGSPGPIKPAALFRFPNVPLRPVSYLWLNQLANPCPEGGISSPLAREHPAELCWAFPL